MPHIDSITFWDKDNYVNFSDTDSQTDYFHSYSLGINQLLTDFWKKRFGLSIQIHFGNNKDLPKYRKRLDRLEKALGYKRETIRHKGIYRIVELSNRCDIQPYDYEDFILYHPDLEKVK